MLYQTTDVISYLQLEAITPSDESIYKCEVTYLDVVESCLVVQFINLTTLSKYSYKLLRTIRINRNPPITSCIHAVYVSEMIYQR